jgi:hypothetical protein
MPLDPTTDPVLGDPAAVKLPITDLTTGAVAGAGVFDKLMAAMRAHLELEFTSNRIRGPEYATVYLGSMEAALKSGMDFLLQQHLGSLEIQLAKQKVANAILEAKVLIAQECKLRAEYDVLLETQLKTAEEKLLLAQKVVTERAQTQPTGVDADSVIGRQKQLYVAQSTGFTRDAEQKAAKLMADTWNVRRTTDDATAANGTNMLDDAAVGRAITKLLDGVGA